MAQDVADLFEGYSRAQHAYGSRVTEGMGSLLTRSVDSGSGEAVADQPV